MQTPTSIGRYTLEAPLGQGGMARVFLGRMEGPGGFSKRVVIKRILPEHANNPSFVEMFLGEARLAALLNHPNVVQVYDFGQDAGHYYLAMEFIDGVSMRAIFNHLRHHQRQASGLVVAQVMAMVADGLAYAHAVKDEGGHPIHLVHRDISPDNLLVTREGVAKVVDFGIAKASSLTQQTTAGALKGKLAYMSPEQVAGEPIDGRVDVYAAGVTMYELLAGRRPFIAANELELAMLIVERNPPPLGQLRPDLDPALRSIVEKAMHKDVSQRYPNAGVLRDALTEYVGGRTKEASSELRALVEEVVVTRPLPVLKDANEAPAPRPSRPKATPHGRSGSRRGLIIAVFGMAAATAVGLIAGRQWGRAKPPEVVVEAPVAPAPTPALVSPPAPKPAADEAPTPSAPTEAPAPVATPVVPVATVTPKKRPTAADGYLTLRSSPWADVTIDGASAGTTPLVKYKVPAGAHAVTLSNDKVGLHQQLTLTITAGQTLVRAVTAAVGEVDVVAPAGTKVFRGSELLGVAPMRPLILVTGKHTLGFVNTTSGERSIRSVEVKSGGQTQLTWP